MNSDPKMNIIIALVSDYFGVSVEDLKKPNRCRLRIARARQVCYWYAREFTQMTLTEIGEHFSDRDHTTVLYGIQHINDLRVKDDQFSKQVICLGEKVIERLESLVNNPAQAAQNQPHDPAAIPGIGDDSQRSAVSTTAAPAQHA